MNTTCGLCGNYNGRSDDDLVTVNGQKTSSVALFGNSWRMTKENDFCPDVLDKDTRSSCPAVEPAVKKVRFILFNRYHLVNR